MTADIESLVREHLRAIRADIGNLRTRMTGVESRLGSFETVMAGMRRDLAHMRRGGRSYPCRPTRCPCGAH